MTTSTTFAPLSRASSILSQPYESKVPTSSALNRLLVSAETSGTTLADTNLLSIYKRSSNVVKNVDETNDAEDAGMDKGPAADIVDDGTPETLLKIRMLTAANLYTQAVPGKFKFDDISRYYLVSDKVPENLRKALRRELTAGGPFLMVRQASFDLQYEMNRLLSEPTARAERDQATQELPPAKNIISVLGHRGTGKTALLALAAQYAISSDALVLSFSGDQLMDDFEGMVEPSSRRKGIMNQPLASRRFFENFALQNKDLLQRIPLQGKYDKLQWEAPSDSKYLPPVSTANPLDYLPFPNAEALPPISTKPVDLFDLCRLGAWRADLASELFYSFVWELQNTTKVNVVVVLDNINNVDHVSEFRHPKRYYRVFGRSLSMTNALLSFLTSPPLCGAVVQAVSSSGTMKNAAAYVARGESQIWMTTLSELELQNTLDHYAVAGFTYDEPDLDTFRRAQLLSGSVPRDVYNFCIDL